MRYWFSSDLHDWHYNIIRYCGRPYKDIKEMHIDLVSQINSRVGINDRYYHLGDISMGRGNQGYINACKLLDEIDCNNVYLIKGNHDFSNFNMLRNHPKVKFVGDYLEITVNKIPVVLFHYPMYSWNKSTHGSHHYYGHCHSMAEDELNRRNPTRKSIDVGIDNAYKILGYYGPFSFENIQEVFSANR